MKIGVLSSVTSEDKEKNEPYRGQYAKNKKSVPKRLHIFKISGNDYDELLTTEISNGQKWK